jgi:hypothetical protein
VQHSADDRDRRLRSLKTRYEWDTIADRMARLLEQAVPAGPADRWVSA